MSAILCICAIFLNGILHVIHRHHVICSMLWFSRSGSLHLWVWHFAWTTLFSFFQAFHRLHFNGRKSNPFSKPDNGSLCQTPQNSEALERRNPFSPSDYYCFVWGLLDPINNAEISTKIWCVLITFNMHSLLV